MTDRRKERDRARRKRRKVREADERRREERNRRFDELVEAWRRNHPGEHEEDRKDLPTRGRMFFGRDLTRCTKARCLHPRRYEGDPSRTAALAAWLYMRSASNNPTRPS